jgi:hypothetical protein
MKLLEYRPEHFDLLSDATRRKDPCSSLLHRPFVNYYYASRDWCKLYLVLQVDGTVGGILGLEHLRFEHAGRPVDLGFGSNFYSLQPGAGGLLFLHWLKTCEVGVVFGGSEDSHRILRQQQWTYYPGVKSYRLNRAYPRYPGEAKWKGAAKAVLGWLRPRLARYARRLPAEAAAVTVREEHDYHDDLLPRTSSFSFRFAPPPEYLAWRYNTRLPFIRYRLFRVLHGGAPAGYVVLNDLPDRLLVAQCDCESPSMLAWGVLRSLVEASREDTRPREVLLTCCHPPMQQIYQQFGFTEVGEDRPFVLGSLRRRRELPSTDCSTWLINVDVGDNGLRAPFRDQP